MLSSIRTLPELGKAIFITKTKVEKLINDLYEIEQANKQYDEEEKQFTADFDSKIKEKRHLEKDYREKETEFKNEQILKFGLEIDFNFLLQASKKTTVDRYENEYKKLKIESDRKIDAFKQKIAEAKTVLRKETNNNTAQLNEIKRKLEEKQYNDKKLEEKNIFVIPFNKVIRVAICSLPLNKCDGLARKIKEAIDELG